MRAIIDELIKQDGIQTSSILGMYEYCETEEKFSAIMIKQYLERTLNEQNKAFLQNWKYWFDGETKKSEFSDMIIDAINKKQIHKGESCD